MGKYEYKETGFEPLGDIPIHWKASRLATIGTFDKGRGIPRSELKEEGVPAILYGDIYTKYDIKTNELINKISDEASFSATKIKKGHLLLTGSGETKEDIGKCVVYNDDKDAFAGGDIIIFESLKHDSLFLSYALNSSSSVYQKIIASKGDIIVHIYASKLRSIKIGLPPLPEQKTIANYLDKACQRIDEIIEIKQKQLGKIEGYLGRKIDEIILRGIKDFPKKDTRKDFIGEIPTHYKVHKLKHITKQITDGTHFTPVYLDIVSEDSIPFLRVTDVQTENIVLEKVKYIDKQEHNELIKRCYPEKGDLLLSKNGTIGITKIVNWDWEFSIFVSLALIKPERLIDVEYLNYYFKSDIMAYQLNQGSKQVTVTNLHLDKIREFYIVTPPIIEQQQIVEKIFLIEQKVSSTKDNILNQITTLQSYRKSLIHECVTGKKQVWEGKIEKVN